MIRQISTLTPGEIAALKVIERLTIIDAHSTVETTVREVSRILAYDYVTVVRFVAELEGLGFIKGVRVGRFKMLSLTAEGVAAVIRLGTRYVVVDAENLKCDGCQCPNHPALCAPPHP